MIILFVVIIVLDLKLLNILFQSAVRNALQQSSLGAFVLGAVVAVAVGVIVWGK